MHIHIGERVLLLCLSDPEFESMRFDPCKSEVSGFGNDIAEGTGKVESAVPWHGGGFDVCERGEGSAREARGERGKGKGARRIPPLPEP